MSEDSLVSLHCASCGVSFGIPQVLEKFRRRDQVAFFCPNGHSNMFPAPSKDDVEKARVTELTDLREKLASASAEIVSLKKEIETMTLELEIWRPSTDGKSDDKPKETSKSAKEANS